MEMHSFASKSIGREWKMGDVKKHLLQHMMHRGRFAVQLGESTSASNMFHLVLFANCFNNQICQELLFVSHYKEAMSEQSVSTINDSFKVIYFNETQASVTIAGVAALMRILKRSQRKDIKMTSHVTSIYCIITKQAIIENKLKDKCRFSKIPQKLVSQFVIIVSQLFVNGWKQR